MADSKRCFVLGAGFSKACGFPLASELTAAIRGYNLLPDPPAGLRSFDDHFRELISVTALTIDDPFELILTRIDELIATVQDYVQVGGQASPVEAWIGTRVNALRRLYLLLSGKSRQPDRPGREAVGRFATSLRPSTDVIISFNWDTLIELTSQQQGLSLSREPGERGALPLIKPHGSIDLVAIPDGETNDRDARYMARLLRLDRWDGVSLYSARNH
jgi:hypothetical protein